MVSTTIKNQGKRNKGGGTALMAPYPTPEGNGRNCGGRRRVGKCQRRDILHTNGSNSEGKGGGGVHFHGVDEGLGVPRKGQLAKI